MYSECVSAAVQVKSLLKTRPSFCLRAETVQGAAHDLAIALSSTAFAVVRCARCPTANDHTALATMMTEGDFVWAGLVYSEREGSETIGLIETFHVSELGQLVSRLLELQEVLAGPPVSERGP
jgi:hypothetical protein